MSPAARVAAAIEVLGDIETRPRPAAGASKDWRLRHGFAGAAGRAAIPSHVYDAPSQPEEEPDLAFLSLGAAFDAVGAPHVTSNRRSFLALRGFPPRRRPP